ncbi:MAG: hypothetical protein WA089_05900, partial [Anaerolineae bacterium]
MSQLIALLAAAILAWQGLRSFATPPFAADGWLWMAGAAVLAAVAFARSEVFMREPQPRQTWHWAARAPLLAGLALLLLGIGVNV